MTVKELSHDEQLALVALTEVAIISDRTITDSEIEQVEVIADELGEEAFHRLADEAEQRFPDRTSLKTFLQTITNPEARELIVGTVLSETLADTLPHEQAIFMDWLACEWNVPVKIDPAP